MRLSSALCLLLALWVSGPALAQSADASIRAELAAPLQEVQRLFKDKQYAQALKALAQAESVPKRTEDENILIERLRAASASYAGELDQAALAYERLVAFEKVPAAEKSGFLEVLATLHLRRKAFADSAKAASRYLAEGGQKPSMRLVLAQAAFFSNDPATTVAQTAELVAMSRKTGSAPEKDILILQANAQQKLKDAAAYTRTLETLLEFHPQTAYWTDLLGRVQSEAGFPADLLLDLYRLQYATGSLGVGEALEMSQLAIKQGFPLEAANALKQAMPGAQTADDRSQLQDALKQAEQLVAADAKPQAAAKVRKAAGFASLYQRWLADPSVAQVDALAAAVTGDVATPANRLRLAAVKAQSGQADEARSLLEPLAVQTGRAGVGRVAGLWLLHLNKAGKP